MIVLIVIAGALLLYIQLLLYAAVITAIQTGYRRRKDVAWQVHRASELALKLRDLP